MEIKNQIKKEIEELKNQKIDEEGVDQGDLEACILFSDIHGLPVEECLKQSDPTAVANAMEFEKDVDRYIEPEFIKSEIKETESDHFLHEEESIDPEELEEISEIIDSKDEDKDFEEWKKKQDEKAWTILYSKHPDWVIDESDYDKILINLLESYQEFKQKLNDMAQLKEIR